MLQTTSEKSQGASPPAADRAYRKAIRHSARVRRLRIVLPLAAVTITLVFAAVSYMRSILPDEIQIESAQLEDGKLVMAKPAIAGRNSEGVPYSLRADRALQDMKTPNMITLKMISAALPVNDKVIARVEAESGIFDRVANRMELDKPFTLNMSSGIDAQFKSAKLDITAGTMETDQAVAIQTKGASIVANALNMKDKGKTMIFTGNVRLNIDPAALRSNRSTETAQP